MPFILWIDARLERILCILATFVTIAAMSYQVLARFVLNIPAPVSDEIAIYAVIWMTYFGASMAAIQRRHIRITIIQEFLSPKAKIAVDIFSNIVSCGFMAFLVYGSWYMLNDAWLNNYTAGSMPFLRTWLILMGLPLAFSLTCVRFVQDTLKLLKEYRALNSAALENKGA